MCLNIGAISKVFEPDSQKATQTWVIFFPEASLQCNYCVDGPVTSMHAFYGYMGTFELGTRKLAGVTVPRYVAVPQHFVPAAKKGHAHVEPWQGVG
eukprot:153485-Rhodomonas_salina.1